MKRILLLSLLACSYSIVFGQSQPRTNEIGFMGGGAYYLGDLNRFRHFGQNTGPAAGFIYRRNYNQRYSFRMTGIWGRVSGADAQSNSAIQQNRNLSFRSDIIEIGAGVEMNYFNYALGDNKSRFSPYLFAQLAYFRMNPKAELNGTWYELQPLGTEGQGTSEGDRPYSLGQISIPMGVGFKADLGKNVGLSMEWGIRKTYTDYLDDVSGTYVDPDILAAENGPLAATLADRSTSQEGEGGNNSRSARGDSNTKDWYVFSGLMITFKIGNRYPCPKAL